MDWASNNWYFLDDTLEIILLCALKSDSDLRLLELLLEKLVVLQAGHKSDSKGKMPEPLHALMHTMTMLALTGKVGPTTRTR